LYLFGRKSKAFLGKKISSTEELPELKKISDNLSVKEGFKIGKDQQDCIRSSLMSFKYKKELYKK